jgi:hypothetical protein
MRSTTILSLMLLCASCRSSPAPEPVSAEVAGEVDAFPPASRKSSTSPIDPVPAELQPFGAATAVSMRSGPELLACPGLPNCYRLSPTLYRGAQPATIGFGELEKLGVRTVISLRAFHIDPRDIGGLAHETIWFKFWHPEDEDVVRFLRIATDPARQPVFVHCQHGSDRTGMMCAIWRVAVDGWSKADAVREMTAGPFGYHPEMKHLVRYVESADISELCRRAGIACAVQPVEVH